MENEETQKSKSVKTTKNLFILIAILILAFIVVIVFKSDKIFGPEQELKTPTTEENVVIENEINKNTPPEGFPSSIPVEADNFIENLKSTYIDRGAVQYTVSYISEKSTSDLYDIYFEYLNDYDYEIEANDKSAGFLYGTKNKNDLSVVVSSSNDKSTVQIAFLVRE